MNSAKVKTLVIISALLLSVGIVTVGCKKKPASWVNTKSMPGSTFVQHNSNRAQNGNSTIVYLGSDRRSSRSSRSGFGPREVSFDFNDLK